MSTDLSKSMLASKDKDELTQIAQAMGAKPPSRARKADIIDLIMQLATGDDPSADAGGSEERAGEAPPVYSADPMADVRAADAKERVGRNAGARGRRGGADNTKDREVAGDGGRPGRQTPDRTDADAREQADGGHDERAAANADDRSDDDPGDKEDRDDKRANGGRGVNSNNDDNDGEPTKPGNRRRRRRGRGRDRADQPDDFVADPVPVEGVLDLRDDGYGFLRVNGFLPTREDVYVSVKQVRQFGLRKGDHLAGLGRPANRSEKNPAMVSIAAVNGTTVAEDGPEIERSEFVELTPVLPVERLTLEREDDPENKLGRVIDLLAPIGKGTRGLVVSPTGVGRTALLRSIAGAVETNHPDVKLIVVLVDERPEEITEMERVVLNGDVVSSSFEQAPDEHGAVVDLAVERAKRLVEAGEDVVVIFDGITRIARAYNLAAAGNAQVSATGIAGSAIHPAKRLFGAARNVQEGGSLTMVASVQADSGSAIDDFVFEEIAGTANMELRLDTDAANQRISPPVDLARSNTHNEERLFEEDELAQVATLRKAIAAAAAEGGSPTAGLEFLVARLDGSDTNADLLKGLG